MASHALYERRFGRVKQASSDEGAGGRGIWMGVAFAASMILEEKVFGPGYPSLFFLCVAAIHTMPLIRDWPLRAYLLIEVAGAALVSCLYMGVEPAHSRDATELVRTQFWITGFGLLGIPMFITGMLDHRLLVSTLRGPQPNGAAERVDSV